MEEYERRRTFAIISHPDAGKTTLTERLLLAGGAIRMAGDVKARGDRRRARSDWMKIEQERGISVTSSVMTFERDNVIFNLLDTPGHADFSEDTYRVLTAVDSALMVIDCAKGVAIAATHEGPLSHYATIEGGSPRISERVAPLIAVPTTSGTGSEVARGAIIIVDDHRKLGFHSWHLVPRAAICDPELTYGLPAMLTAATGMDAIAHCMETFMAAAFNPPADGIALDGLTRGWAHIERATRNGQDAEARRQLMSASMQGAMAFQKGLGCVHSLSHSLGGVNPRLHHGTLNAMFLPAVVRFNAEAESVRAEQRLQRMAHAMGLDSGSDIPEAIRDMNARLGLPTGLAAMGVERAQFAAVIGGALKDHCHGTNPRLASADDYEQMLATSL